MRAPSETLRAWLALVATGLLFLAPRPAASQVTATPDPTLLPTTLVVTVRSPSAPVAGASVTIAGTSAGVVSSSEGRAVLAALPGRRFIHVRALGFEPFDSLLLVGSAPATLAISLRRAAVQLDSVRVTASNVGKPARYAATTKFDGFYERRATAIGGTFLTREDIEAMEVYRGVAELPSVARGDACAAIFVWTRYGGGSVTHPKQP